MLEVNELTFDMMRRNLYHIFSALTAAVLMSLHIDASAQILIPQIKLLSPITSATKNVANDQFVLRCGYRKPSPEYIATTRLVVDDKVFTHQEIEQIDLDKDDILSLHVEKDSSGIAKYTNDGNIKGLLIIKTKSRKLSNKKL